MIGGRVVDISETVRAAVNVCLNVGSLPWSLLACHLKGPTPAFHLS